jgi:hypothetical protein
MCRLVQLAVAIFVALWSFIAHSAVQAQNESIKLFDEEFHERLDEHGRVSGDIVMGVMIGPARAEEKDHEEGEEGFVLADLAPRQSADVAVTHLPKNVPASARSADNAPLFCVRINSKDGRFEAENTYEVTDSATIPDTPFPYEGSHAPVVNSMRAVSLVKTGRCGNRTEEVVPSVWAGTDLGDGRRALHVFVNSAGNPTVAVVGSDIGFVPCEDVADATTLKYTASCILPFEMLEAHKQGDGVPVTFFVTRSLGEEDFNIVVKLPGGDS